ncbi:hypothetical protein MMC12_005773 [Toensbergia leucococca]|nr:hypothetical protein [Toensbergia leucococca]
MATTILLFTFTGLAAAAPSIVLPLNAQVPPIARISEPYYFVFSESSFSSSAPTIDYALTDSPGWLELDSPSRSLSGKPGTEDGGPVNVNLVATDDTGSASMPITLIVSTESGPVLGTPIASQLPAFGSFSGPDILTLAPSSPLSFSFSPNTFTNTSPDTVYYALCANNTPLPSWIHFDADSLSFSGVTPQSTSPVELSQVYSINLTASDIVGFSEAIASFQLVVERHVLAFGSNTHTINITQGSSFNYSGLRTDLTLDGQPIQSSNLGQVTANTPEWMSLDPKSLVLSGTPPMSLVSQNITISATDTYGDMANITIQIQTSTTLNIFRGTIGVVNATIGSEFNYTLGGIILGDSDLCVTADLGNTSSWLSFDATNLSFQGRIPNDVVPQQDLLNVTATSGTQSHSQTFTINIVQGKNSASGPGTSSISKSTKATATPHSTNKTISPSVDASTGNASKNHATAAAVVVSLVALLIALILFCWCRRRRRFRPSIGQISRPILPASHFDFEFPANTKEKVSYEHKRTSSSVPRLDIPGFLVSAANKRNSQSRWSRRTIDEGTRTQRPESWRDYVRRQTSTVDLDTAILESCTIPEFNLTQEDQTSMRRKRSSHHLRLSPPGRSRSSVVSNASPARDYWRQSKRRSDMSFASSGFLSTHRINGIGHGKGTNLGVGGFGPPGFGTVRDSWRNPYSPSWTTIEGAATTTTNRSSSQYLESEHSQYITTTMRSFPRPPTSNTLNQFGQPQTIPELDDLDGSHRVSIRSLTYPSRAVLNRRRAVNRRTHNPLFSAGASSRLSTNLVRKKSLQNRSLHTAPRIESLNPEKEQSHSESGADNHRLLRRKLRRSYSQGSSVCEPSKLSPPKKSPRRNVSHGWSGRFNETVGRISRFRSGSSLGSSRRYESADSEVQSEGTSERAEDFLEEGVDEEGNKRWFHPGHPNPLALHGMAAGGGSEGHESDLDVERVFGAASGSKAQRLSQLKAQAEGKENFEDEERRIIVGDLGKRPVSVDNSDGLRAGRAGSTSMRGDVAFL